MTEQLEDINAEIEETQAEIDAITAEEAERSAQAAQEAEARAQVPATAQLVNGNVAATFQTNPVQTRADEDPTASMEYRMGFSRQEY